MCGRYTITNPKRTLAESLGTQECQDLSARYNVAPTQDVPVVVIGDTGSRRLVQMRWGLTPNWSNGHSRSRGIINTRAETVLAKSPFIKALRPRPCIVPTDGFYEWRRELQTRQPYLLRLPGSAPFTFAGLWNCWRDRRGRLLNGFTILTTKANALVQTIHDRMPVILDQKDREEWLSLESVLAVKNGILKPYPGLEMEAVPVSTYVNNVSHDSSGCLHEVEALNVRRLF